MSDSTERSTLNSCGCCKEGESQTEIHNRPGLPALAYRFHTHGSALAAMKARLSKPLTVTLDELDAAGEPETEDVYALKKLTTRSADDPAIAVLDAWASVIDVLTFYQERIANEGFLRTAAERRSVLELARAIGYELNPGVAADALLAFTVEDAEGAPQTATVPVGTKVMSIPGQDEKPQTFETVEEIEARAEWNELAPQQAEKQSISAGLKELYLKGVKTKLKPGDALLIVGQERMDDPTSERWDFRRLLTVTEDTDLDLTKVTWEDGLGWNRFGRSIQPAEKGVQVFTFRLRTALFGSGAPDWRVMPASVRKEFCKSAYPTGSASALSSCESDDEWPDFTISDISSPETKTVHLEGVHQKIVAGGWVLISIPSYYEVYEVSEAVEDSRANFTLTSKTTRVKLKGENLVEKFDDHVRDAVVFAESEELEIAEKPLTGPVMGDRIVLDGLSPDLEEEQRLTVSGKLQRVRLASVIGTLYLVSADGTEQVLLKADDSLQVASPPKLAKTGGTDSDDLDGEDLVEILEDSSVQDVEWPLIDRDGFAGYATIPSNLIELEAAEEDDDTVCEAAAIADGSDAVTSDRDYTTIALEEALAYCYDRTTVTINANTAPATHGETVKNEVLGNGDGAKTNQSFTLKKPPLTYVSASTSSGGKSTLAVRVEKVLWTEEDSLYDLDPDSRSYTVRLDDEGEVSVIFGDGKSGARLPSGSENLVATYRSGIGSDGNVDAGQLSLLTTRPLGIRGVTNPLPASGGTDSEELEDARDNAPLKVLTLDRIVSLRDFEDFARAFSGIGKAQAVCLWDGHTRLVHITAADSEEEPIDTKSKTYKNLMAAMDAARDPIQPVVVSGFLPRTFSLSAGLILDPAYDADDVMEDATDALTEAFAFDQRSFGQPVTAAEVVTVLQEISGVTAVDIDNLELDPVTPKASIAKGKIGIPNPHKLLGMAKSQSPATSLLPADPAAFETDTGQIQLAELLLINEQGIRLYAKETSS